MLLDQHALVQILEILLYAQHVVRLELVEVEAVMCLRRIGEMVVRQQGRVEAILLVPTKVCRT